MSHNERCKECKVRVRQLLEKIYGPVITNQWISLGTRPEEFHEHPRYSDLNNIHSALQHHRGFTEFIRASHVDVDFFLPEQKMIVEFDESQHFTEPRKITLSHYPSNIDIGFSQEEWMKHCDEIRAYDNDPAYRDEQRAWYDTLRDFIPEMKGFRPTMRMYAKDMAWCTLDPEKSEDVEKFKSFLDKKSSQNVNQSTQLAIFQKTLPCWIATVTIRSEHEKDPTKNGERLRAIPIIISPILESRSSDGIILFPGGWIHTGEEEAKTAEDAVSLVVSNLLKQTSCDVKVCIGIDGKMDEQGFDHDQIALVIDKNGIIQRVRKFCASPQEKEAISNDLEPMIEAQANHVFNFKNKKFFISVCYDICANKPRPKGFGLTNPGIDYVLNLVHRFPKPKSGEGSGVWYFVRDNFGGASRDWKCPVFGTGIFIERDITDKWRTGVNWNLGNIATNSFGITADVFSIPYETIPRIVFPQGFTDSYAEIRFFDHIGIIRSEAKPLKKLPRQQKNMSYSPSGSTSILYEKFREELDPLFGKPVIDQTKFTYRAENEIGYPNKNELDMISLYKPGMYAHDKVRFRVYPYILASHQGLQNADEIIKVLPEGSVKKQERENPHLGNIFIEGVFSSEEEIEKFVKWIVFGKN